MDGVELSPLVSEEEAHMVCAQKNWDMSLDSPPSLDWKTCSLFAVYVCSLLASIALADAGRISLPMAFLVSLMAFNLSFTIWHECVHNTVSSDRRISAAVGMVATFFLLFPGYFALRREHLLHHKYQGDPDKDPVYQRVQCGPWIFPFHLFLAVIFDRRPPHPERRLPPAERFADGVGYLLVVALAAVMWAHGRGGVFVAALLLPRIVIFPIHAFYVCWLPHSSRGRRTYQLYRVVLRNFFTRYLTLYHCYHGLHHVWPSIPWHGYRACFQAKREDLERRGVEILGSSA